jgi:dolichyl-phosphate-mannose-protein mannosyltransferase
MSLPFGLEQYFPTDPHRVLTKARTLVNARLVEYVIVSAAIIISLVAACIHLRNSTIWYDEAITLLTTSGHAQLDWALGLAQFKPSANLGKIVSELYEQDVHPPLYFWTLALWRVVFGESLEIARALSALFILGTLGLLYRLAIDLRMRWAPVPVVVYALSAVGARYAYNARPYAMVSFLIVLTLLLAHRRSRWAGVCAAACIATHYFAALCILPILVWQCLSEWKSNRRWVWLTAISFAFCDAPLIPLLRVHIGARPLQYPGFGIFHKELWALLKGSMESIMPSTWLPGWTIALFVAASFVAAGCWWAYRRNKLLVPFSYAAFLCGFLLLAIVTNKSIGKMPTDYYLGIAAPFAALLIGYGVTALPRATPLLALVVIAGALTPVSMTKSVDYRAMMSRVRAQCPDCPILVGVGYAGAVPACVLYENKGMNVYLLNQNDQMESAIQRMGIPRTFILIPTNEPATVDLEHQFVETYPSTWENGYFQIDVPDKQETVSVTAHETARPSKQASPLQIPEQMSALR